MYCKQPWFTEHHAVQHAHGICMTTITCTCTTPFMPARAGGGRNFPEKYFFLDEASESFWRLKIMARQGLWDRYCMKVVSLTFKLDDVVWQHLTAITVSALILVSVSIRTLYNFMTLYVSIQQLMSWIPPLSSLDDDLISTATCMYSVLHSASAYRHGHYLYAAPPREAQPISDVGAFVSLSCNCPDDYCEVSESGPRLGTAGESAVHCGETDKGIMHIRVALAKLLQCTLQYSVLSRRGLYTCI